MRNERTTPNALVLLVALAIGSSAVAQTPGGPMGVKQCVAYALEHQPSAVIARNNVEYAKQQEHEALAGYLPQVNGTVTMDDNLKRPTSVFPAGSVGTEERRVQLGNQFNTNASLQADQVIYDQTLIAGIQASKPNTAIAELNQELSEEDIVYNTSAAYAQAMLLKQQQRLLEDNEARYNELVPILRLQLDKGVIQPIDLDRTRVGQLNVRSQLNVSRTNFELAVNRLKNAMGMPLEQELVLPDSSDIGKELLTPDSTALDLPNKLEYRLYEQTLSLREIDVERKRAQALPVLSAYGKLGTQALGNDLSASYENWYDYSAVGLKLSVPIFSSLRRTSQVKQSRLNLLNAQEQMKLNTESWKLAFANARTRVQSNYAQASADRENLQLAQQVFDNTTLQYQLGSSSLSDLLNADYAFKEARNNYLITVLSYWTSVLDLHRAQSSLRQFITTL